MTRMFAMQRIYALLRKLNPGMQLDRLIEEVFRDVLPLWPLDGL